MASPRALSTLVAAGRVGVGTALLLAPAAVGRPWLGAAAETGGGGVAVRALGVRDLALGALTVAALSGRLGAPPRPGHRAGHGLRLDVAASRAAPALIAAGAVCDMVDGAALLTARRELPPAAAPAAAFALGAAVTGLALARRLRAC